MLLSRLASLTGSLYGDYGSIPLKYCGVHTVCILVTGFCSRGQQQSFSGGGLLLTGFGKVCDGPPTEVSALSIIKGVGL